MEGEQALYTNSQEERSETARQYYYVDSTEEKDDQNASQIEEEKSFKSKSISMERPTDFDAEIEMMEEMERMRYNSLQKQESEDEDDVDLITNKRQMSKNRQIDSLSSNFHGISQDEEVDISSRPNSQSSERDSVHSRKRMERGLFRSEGKVEEQEVNLITSRKQLSQARKMESLRVKKSIRELVSLIKDEKWDDVLAHLYDYEHDADSWIEETNKDGSLRWRSLPIHFACEHNPSFDVINELIRLYPASLETENYGGDLPIHVACREGVQKEILDLMMNLNPESLEKKECEGRLPLHLALFKKSTDACTIQDILCYYEKAARTPDDFGLLPLHYACSKEATAASIEALLKVYPYAIEKVDDFDLLPIDRLLASKNSEKAKIRQLLSRDVSFWSQSMMSLIVDLSSKQAYVEQKEKEWQEKERQYEDMESELEKVKDENKLFAANERHWKKTWLKQKQVMKERYEKKLRQESARQELIKQEITDEKEMAEKKASDLRILIEELVNNLREKKDNAEETEEMRKDLKIKAYGLVKKAQVTEIENEQLRDDNEALKMEIFDLKMKMKKNDMFMNNTRAKTSKHYEVESLFSAEKKDLFTADARSDEISKNEDVYECRRIDDEKSF